MSDTNLGFGRPRTAVLVIVATMLAAAAFAEEPPVSDRPDLTGSSSMAGAGSAVRIGG